MTAGAARPLLRMALRNVRKNWRHSLGSMLSIAVGFIAIGLFDGYLDDLLRRQSTSFASRNMYGEVLIEKRGASGSEGREDPFRYGLGEAEQSFLDGYLAARAGDVETRVRILHVRGLASTGKTGAVFIGFGFDTTEGATLRGDWAWDAAAGKPLQLAGPDAVMLASGLAGVLDCARTSDEPHLAPDGTPIARERPFACRRGKAQLTATTEAGQLNVVEPHITGIFSAPLKDLDGRFLFLPLPLAQRLLDTKQVTTYSVRLAPAVVPAVFAEELMQAAQAEGFAIDAMPWQLHPTSELFRRGSEVLAVYRSFMVLIVVTIAGMSVLMTMMKSVSERTREVGTLRSLGFLRRHIVGLFALEAGVLALSSAALGLVLTLAITFALNAAGITYKAGVLAESIPLVIAVAPRAYAFGFGFLTSVAVAAALLPARRAAWMGIPQALGHV